MADPVERRGRPKYPTTVCLLGPRPDPGDPLMEIDPYFGRVPKDFNPRSGLSKTHRQVRNPDTGLYEWKTRD